MNSSNPGDLVFVKGASAGRCREGYDSPFALKLIFVSAEKTSYVYFYSDEATVRFQTLESGLKILGTKLYGVADE